MLVMTGSTSNPLGADMQTKPRARNLGIPFDGVPGPFNAITDVEGVTVGLQTLISGEGKLVVGEVGLAGGSGDDYQHTQCRRSA